MWVLNNRIPRNLKKNIARWLSIFLLVVICLYLVVSMFGEAITIFYNHDKYMDEYNINDGSFTTFAKFSEEELSELEALGFDIEECFYGEFNVMSDDLLRVFKNRDSINRIAVIEGHLAETAEEILIEQNFAEAHDIDINDDIEIAGLHFKVCGLGCSPDYEAVVENINVSTDRDYFGTAFLSEEGYEAIISTGGLLKSETFLYVYKKNDPNISDDVLKNYIQEMEFDETRVTDKYFNDMLDDILETKVNLKNAINDLSEASDDILEGSDDLNSGAEEMCDAVGEFNDHITDLTDGIREISDGAEELVSNSDALVTGSRDVFTALLQNAENQLSESGIAVKLTIENYENELKAINTDSLSQEALNSIDSAVSSLNEVNAFYNGVVSYTQGVEIAASGARQLSSSVSELSDSMGMLNQNLGQLAADPELNMYLAELNGGYDSVASAMTQLAQGQGELRDALGTLESNSSTLLNGASSMQEALLSQASSELSDYGLNVSLTADNYESQLSSLRNDIPNQIGSQVNSSINSLIESLNSYRTFYNGLNDYVSGVGELNDGISEMYTAIPDLVDAATRLNDSTSEFLGYTNDFRDGANDLREGVDELEENMDDIDEFFEIDIDNLVEFNEYREVTPIIRYAKSSAQSGAACGVIVLFILSYILSVFVTHEIDNESTVIGALYSMGVTRGSLIRHYIAIPVIITMLGGLAGTLIGMSPVGSDLMLQDTLYYNSMPPIESVVSFPLLLGGTFIPPLISAVVTLLIIRSRLSKSPLSLLRREKKIKSIKNSKESKLSFVNAFRIKQIKNESVTSFIVFIGLLLPLLLLMLSLDYLVVKNTVVSDIERDVKLKNIYAVKYTPEDIPDGSEECYMETLSMDSLGVDYDISFMGIVQDTECFNFKPEFEKNSVLVGTGMAYKFNIKAGDTITFRSDTQDRFYTFNVSGIVDYAPGLTMFMDIDDMRETFNRDDEYYNALLSLEDVDIEPGRLYSTVKRDDMIKSAKMEMDSISFLVYMLVVIAVIIFIIITYLMIKLMIDRAAVNISLMKIFGFYSKEINKLYIDGNFMIICISALIGIPFSKIMVDKFWFPIMNSGIKMGFNPHYPFWIYIVIMVSIVILYNVVTLLLKRKVASIPMTDVLKNRE